MNDDPAESASMRYRETHDMVAVEDFSSFSDRLHKIMADHDPEKAGSPQGSRSFRLTMDIPLEWLMLALWMDARRRLRERGEDVPIEASIGEQLSAADVGRAKALLWQNLYEQYHDDLHWLSTGGHPLLQPKSVPLANKRPLPDHPDDDDIPF